jgi:anti-sigma-K factor RskA
MNEITCLEIDELLPGYAANALEEEERCAAAGHLAECRRHDTELAGLRLGFAGLAMTIDPEEPPGTLRGRVLEAFDREVEGPPAAVPPRPQRPARWTTVGGFGYALAAGLLIIAIGLAVWGASRGGGEADILVRETSDQTGTLQVVYIPSHNRGLIDYELSSLPADRTYQAWHVDDSGRAVSLGVLNNTRGSHAFEGDFDAGVSALSVEPSAGSVAPTTAPLLVTPLSES